MDDTRFSGVVSSLQLRNVDNMARHGRSGNETAASIVLELLAVQVSALLTLASPNITASASAVENAIKIR